MFVSWLLTWVTISVVTHENLLVYESITGRRAQANCGSGESAICPSALKYQLMGVVKLESLRPALVAFNFFSLLIAPTESGA